MATIVLINIGVISLLVKWNKLTREHHLPAPISGFFGGKKIIKCSLPATNHQNTSRVN
jgi:hypothetical protein